MDNRKIEMDYLKSLSDKTFERLWPDKKSINKSDYGKDSINWRKLMNKSTTDIHPHVLILDLDWYEKYTQDQWKKFYDDNISQFGKNGVIIYFQDDITYPRKVCILQEDGSLKKGDAK